MNQDQILILRLHVPYRLASIRLKPLKSLKTDLRMFVEARTSLTDIEPPCYRVSLEIDATNRERVQTACPMAEKNPFTMRAVMKESLPPYKPSTFTACSRTREDCYRILSFHPFGWVARIGGSKGEVDLTLFAFCTERVSTIRSGRRAVEYDFLSHKRRLPIIAPMTIDRHTICRIPYLPEISHTFSFRRGNPSEIFSQLIQHQCHTFLVIELLIPLGNNPQMVTMFPDVEDERDWTPEGGVQIASAFQSRDGSVGILKVNDPCRDIVAYGMPIKIGLVKVQRAQNLSGMADSSLVWNRCYHVILRASHEVLDSLVGTKSCSQMDSTRDWPHD